MNKTNSFEQYLNEDSRINVSLCQMDRDLIYEVMEKWQDYMHSVPGWKKITAEMKDLANGAKLTYLDGKFEDVHKFVNELKVYIFALCLMTSQFETVQSVYSDHISELMQTVNDIHNMFLMHVYIKGLVTTYDLREVTGLYVKLETIYKSLTIGTD